jgi:hypothetical protein
MPTEPAKLAVKILGIFEGQAEGPFAISVLAVLALATLLCAIIYLVRRRWS